MPRMAFARLCAVILLALVAAGPAPQPQNNPSFNLVNHAKSTIKQAFATPSTETQWGRDVLGDAVLPVNGSFPVRLPLGPCSFDVRVFYANGEKAEKRNLDTCNVDDVTFTEADAASPDTPAAPPDAPAAPSGADHGTDTQPPADPAQPSTRELQLVVYNLSKLAITSVFASPTGVDNWGEDRLGDNLLPADGTITIHLPDAGKCLYDVRFVYSDDSNFEKRKIDFCSGPVTLRVH